MGVQHGGRDRLGRYAHLGTRMAALDSRRENPVRIDVVPEPVADQGHDIAGGINPFALLPADFPIHFVKQVFPPLERFVCQAVV